MEVSLSALHVSLFEEDQNGNDITCVSDPSSDSQRNSSRDVEMIGDCGSDLISATSIIKNVDIETHVAAVGCMKTAGDNCNQNMTFMISGLQNGSIDSESTTADVRDLLVKNGNDISRMCPNTDAQPGFVSPSYCSSSNKNSSVSSGEMLIRSNSFIVHESEQLLSASVLEDSSDMPSDISMMPGLLPDVCEGLVNNMLCAAGQNNKHSDFGVTFIQSCNQTFTMEEDVFQTVFHNGPEESRTSRLVAGLNHIECVTPANMKKSHVEAERATHSTSAEGKTFQILTSEELDISGNAQTSTPVQSVSSKTFCFSESSLNKSKSDFGSPLAQVVKEQKNSVFQKPKSSLTASNKSNKLEPKKYAKPDFSNVRSKIMSKPNSVLKPSNVAVGSASANIKQPKIQSRPSHSMQSITTPTKSISVVSSSSTLTCASLKKDQNNVIKRAHSSTCQDTAPARKSRPRMWSETIGEGTVKESQVSKIESTPTNAKSSSVGGFLSRTRLNKPGDRPDSSREEKSGFLRKPQKPSSKADSSQPVGAALRDWRKSSLGSQPLSSRAGGTSPAQTPAANIRPPPLSASKLKPGTARKNDCSTSDMPSPSPRSKLSTFGGNPTTRVTNGTGAEGSRGTVSRFSLMTCQPLLSTSKLPLKTRTQVKSLSAFSGHTKPGDKRTASLSNASVMCAVSVSKPPVSSRPARLPASVSGGCFPGKGNCVMYKLLHTSFQKY